MKQNAIILTVDDDPGILTELKEVLVAEGHTCLAASCTETALAIAQEVTPDLIICDINLDGESGLDLCERIKAEPGTYDVPVMFLSGAPIPNVIQQAHAAGGVYYLRKPFDPTVLLDLVNRSLWMPHLAAAQLEV